MSQLPATKGSLFANILKKAAEKKPEGRAASALSRFIDTSDEQWVVCDHSISMNDYVRGTSKTKMDMLRIALEEIANSHPNIKVLFFSDTVTEGSAKNIPPFGPSTALDEALRYLKPKRPARTIVISDGQPNSVDRALDATADLTGQIDVVYCGSEHDATCIEFMQKLSRAGGGRVVNWDDAGTISIASALRKLLVSPVSS